MPTSQFILGKESWRIRAGRYSQKSIDHHLLNKWWLNSMYRSLGSTAIKSCLTLSFYTSVILLDIKSKQTMLVVHHFVDSCERVPMLDQTRTVGFEKFTKSEDQHPDYSTTYLTKDFLLQVFDISYWSSLPSSPTWSTTLPVKELNYQNLKMVYMLKGKSSLKKISLKFVS